MAVKVESLLAVATAILETDEDDDNESSELDLPLFMMAVSPLMEGEAKTRIQHYVEEVVPNYSDHDFRRMFRITRETFEALVIYLNDCPELQPAGPGRREPISTEKQLLVALWYFGSQDTISRIADRFGISESTVLMCRNKILSVLVGLRHRFIKWPNQQEMLQEANEFSQRNVFPGIAGAIDGTHIRIKAPKQHPQAYVNRKGFHSIQLQCVCRHNMLFSNVFTGFPGSCHDARVLKNSDLWLNGLRNCNMVHHILGDGAYPLRKWLLTPYRDNGNLSREQRRYNHYHSSNRVVIERAFALLKGRFRRLQNIDSNSVERMCEIIMASCVLHNICILQNDDVNDFVVENDELDNDHVIHFQEQNAEAVLKRDTLSRNLL